MVISKLDKELGTLSSYYSEVRNLKKNLLDGRNFQWIINYRVHLEADVNLPVIINSALISSMIQLLQDNPMCINLLNHVSRQYEESW